jgi:nucleoside-diphosphate-sugar epimerase
MKVILFGATGMIGHGALNAALTDARVERVLTVGRHPTGRCHPRRDELVVANLFDLTDQEEKRAGFDVCLFCLGVSSAGMKEA